MLVIIDGHSLAYKIFYKTPPLYNSKRIPTSMIHSFLNTILSIKEKIAPNRMIVVFDSKGETFRHQFFSEYKANRSKAPEDLITQVEILKRIIPLLNIELYAKDGFEADDLIYTFSIISEDPVLIVTKDKDLAQVVNDKIKIFDYQTNEIIDRDKIYEKFGIYPEQIIDYLALTGDSSDNIPGVKGIGEKTAISLLKEFGSLDNIYNNLDKIKTSVREKLEKDREVAYLSKRLVTLKVIEDPDQAKITSDEDLKQVLTELELKTIHKRIFGETKHVTISEGKVTVPEVVAFLNDKIYISDGQHYQQTETIFHKNCNLFYNLKDLIKQYKIDITDLKDLEILSWLTDPDAGTLKFTEQNSIESFFEKIFQQKDQILKRMDDYKLWDLYWDIEHKIIKILADMEVVGIKLDPNKLKETDEKIKILLKNEKELIDKILGEEINLNSPKQLSFVLFEKFRLIPFKKNKTGFSTDEDSLRNMISLNPSHEELLKAILRYREYSKLISTYTSKLSEYINPQTNRIHTQFKQTGTATGRLSSNNPNLQNIPQKGELGSEIRSAFIAEDGYSFLSIDYSQIELRILAHISDDEGLKEAFEKDLDIHNITAMKVFGLKESEITKDIRRIAKAVNFGIIYGLSPYGLSRDVGIPQTEAKTFIKKYFENYPKVKNYMTNIVREAEEKGFVKTICKRPRFIPDINSSNSTIKQRAERIAINSPIQGSAADIIKLAMIKSYEYLKEQKINGDLILQVHDELIFEIDDKDIDKTAKDIKVIMENIYPLRIPLKVNVSISKNLGELK